ncbi:hypothetical protein PR048_009300 [Dryococelus australis]|uniref:DDE-1 domain-containing protein n=1 Tax=Dryococelus australis TaxID=614101 RepID=A0ABQ9HZH3_9NEOP|nr:hypothetical protein PR048_009300 [Dryococelus australis]
MKSGRQEKLGFMLKKRYPNLSVRKPEALSLARARSMNKADVTNFFERFDNLLNENNFATGVFQTPFVILKGENVKQEFRDNLLPGSVVFVSDSSYLTIELFQKFLEHFVTHKTQGKKANLLVLDGYATHIKEQIILQFTVDNNVIMIGIPPHTSHYIQPLDRSLKMHYYGACNSWIKQNPTRRITKLLFGVLLSQVWVKACSVENGVSGFRACAV